MTANLRNHIVIFDSITLNTDGGCSGSGPNYVVTYDPDQDLSVVQIGQHVYVEKRVAGAGSSSTVSSTYVYLITAIGETGSEGDSPEMTLKYLYDTAGTGDDSPCDLPGGGGSSGSPSMASHKVVMILGAAFNTFV